MRKSLQKVTLMCLFALFAIVAKAQNDVTAGTGSITVL